MKQKLTKEQSQRLIELGNVLAFTIGDLLEVVPKDLYDDGYTTLRIETMYVGKQLWEVSYHNCDESEFSSVELIDALFDLVVWFVENGHIQN